MTGYSIVQHVLRLMPEMRRLYDNLNAYGRLADEIGDVPPAFFKGLDVISLNHNGLALDGRASVARKVGDLCVVNEVSGHADPALAIALPGGSLTLAVVDFASPAQKERILARFDSDQPVWGAFAMTEPTSGTDAARVRTVATKVPGGYVLNGEKCFIGNAGRAAYVIVFATIAPEKGQFGIRAFFAPVPARGMTIDDGERMLGLRAVRASRIRLSECFVPDDDLIGIGTKHDPARSFAYAQASWNAMRPCLGSLIVGATQRVLDELGTPTEACGPVLRAGLAATAVRHSGAVYSARLLCRRAAALIDAGQPSLIASSMAKAYAADCARACIEDVMDLPGIGSHPSFADFSRWRRDFHAFNIMEGTGDIHRLMIARDRNRQRQSSIAPITREPAAGRRTAQPSAA